MSAQTCHREDELLDALSRGLIGPELEGHIGGCAACSDLRLVAGGLLDERMQAVAEAPVPTAGTMWWRMQVRHRQEVAATARRSLLIGQAATLSIAIVLIVSLFGVEIAVGVREVIAAVRLSTPLLIAVGAWLLLAPLAGWVAIRQK
ncbi:MAG TPA: hypothetical protein VM779_15915 [Thermoanaerobaculia bacterium]|nr:hypothetical protein [Thermoanaerobaculia bacterium]